MKDMIRNPGGASVAILVSMLMVSLGAWGTEHSVHGDIDWGKPPSLDHVFSLMGSVGAVIGAWL